MKKIIYSIFTSAMLLTFCLVSTGVVAQSPANDDVCNALFIPTDGTVSYHNNYNTSVEANEDGTISPPNGDGAGNFAWYETGITNSVWFKIVAPATGSVIVDLCNGGDSTDFDTQIAIYSVGTCSDFNTFTFLGGNDDIACAAPADPFASTVEVACLTPGDTIYVLVDGWFSAGTSSDTVGSFSFSSTEIPAPTPVPINSVSSIKAPSCTGATDGSVAVLASGGVGLFSYQWSTGPTTINLENIGAGTYTVVVTDQCQATDSVTIVVSDPAPIVVNAGDDVSTCEGEEVQLGGAPSATGGRRNLGPAVYGIDLGGPSFINTSLSSAGVTNVIATGGFAPGLYGGDLVAGNFFAINNGNATAPAQNLHRIDIATGASTLIGTCNSVTGHTWVGIAYDEMNDILYGASTSGTAAQLYTIDYQGTGAATPTTTFKGMAIPIWIAIDTSGLMYSLDIGTDSLYSVNPVSGETSAIGPIGFGATNAQGADFDPVTNKLYLAAYNGTSAELRVADVNTGYSFLVRPFDNVTEVGAFAIAEDVINPYSYNWSPTDGLSDAFAANPMATVAASTTYTLTILDGCNEFASDDISVTVTDSLKLSVSSAPDNGSGNGSVSVSATGGSGVYSYAWSTGDMTADVSGLSSDSSAFYTVTVTDSLGCTAVDSVFVGSNVSIDNLLAAGINTFEVYPNPSTGVFTVNIAMKSREALTLSVLDIRGKQVLAKSLEATDRFVETLQLTDLPAGIYLLSVQTPKGIATQRLTIQ